MTMHIPEFIGPMAIPRFPETRREMLFRLINEAAAIHGVAPHRVAGPERDAPAVRARQGVYLALREAGWTLPQIGKAMNRDHTTVMSGIAAAQARRAEA